MVNELFDLQKKFQNRTIPPTPKERINQLTKIHNWLLENRNRIKTVIHKDFNKPFEEIDLSEIYPIISEIKHAKKNLAKWVKAKIIKKTLALLSHSAYIRYEPKGIILIISPWNYPFQLAIGPVISAIAAGNSVIIKPSEISKNTSKLIEEMVSNLFNKHEVAVVQGGKEIVAELLELPFDHIFFTGSTSAGKIVAKGAANHLSSTTLELGGKSPLIIDKTANFDTAAEKIIWGKFLNKGQTCVAPDYILFDKSIREILVDKLIEQVKNIYGQLKIEDNLHYAKIIDEQHHERLTFMIDEAISSGSKILYGGKFNRNNRFIEPTIILTNRNECSLTEDEIFGPILPLVEYSNLNEAINWINERPVPLALYIFTKSKQVEQKIISSTQSGSVGINEVVLQYGHQNLPFGGVKESGIGRSHGFDGFKSFSNERSYIKSGKINFTKFIYPPFNNAKRKMINILIKYL